MAENPCTKLGLLAHPHSHPSTEDITGRDDSLAQPWWLSSRLDRRVGTHPLLLLLLSTKVPPHAPKPGPKDQLCAGAKVSQQQPSGGEQFGSVAGIS